MKEETPQEKMWREWYENDSEEALARWSDAAVREWAKSLPPGEFADWNPPEVKPENSTEEK